MQVVSDDALDIALNGEILEDGFVSALEDRFESVHEIDVYEH